MDRGQEPLGTTTTRVVVVVVCLTQPLLAHHGTNCPPEARIAFSPNPGGSPAGLVFGNDRGRHCGGLHNRCLARRCGGGLGHVVVHARSGGPGHSSPETKGLQNDSVFLYTRQFSGGGLRHAAKGNDTGSFGRGSFVAQQTGPLGRRGRSAVRDENV